MGAKHLMTEQQFWGSCVKIRGCWLWTRGQLPQGYGAVSFNGKSQLAHRVAWLLTRGPIRKGLHIDHLCRKRSCINPRHMEVVTPKVNILRGVGITARNAKKLHCKYGHPLIGSNLRLYSGWRHCRQCKRDWYHRRRVTDPSFNSYKRTITLAPRKL